MADLKTNPEELPLVARLSRGGRAGSDAAVSERQLLRIGLALVAP